MGEKKKASDVLEINVMMVGGRRCGKTSVLAAMQSCFDNIMRDTPLVLSTEGSATDELEEKRREIRKYFAKENKRHYFVPDIGPTLDEAKYTFRISLKGSSNKIKINFVDFPGEWLTNGDKRERLESLMAKSRILLVAIDTPHLMEEKGKYNDQQNRCYRICEMIKSVGFADPDKGASMILLIPLKCERYRTNNRMDDVATQTEKAYESLVQYIEQPGKNGERSLCQVAVTPIFTMGCAEFSYFDRDSDGEVIEDPIFHTPQSAFYKFPDATKKEPEPKYCEQPLLRVLEFTLNAAQEEVKKGKNPFVKLTDALAKFLKNAPVNPLFSVVAEFLSESIAQWGGTEDYLEHAKAIRKRLIYSNERDGYRVIIGSVPGGKH